MFDLSISYLPDEFVVDGAPVQPDVWHWGALMMTNELILPVKQKRRLLVRTVKY